MSSLKNLVFDLGGVLYAIDVPLTQRALAALSPEGIQESQLPVAFQHMDAFEMGHFSPSDFRRVMGEHFALKADESQFDGAWNALLLGMMPGRVEDLMRLKERYRLILLSNTNLIHQDFIRAECGPLFACFERVFFSYEMRLRKPDPAIYRVALAEMGMVAEESLFIDDNHPNILGAESVGIRGFHFSGQAGGDWKDLMKLLG